MAMALIGRAHYRQGDLGFTLLEVIVVFTIMALILAIVPPYLPQVIDSINVKAAIRELATSLKHTRSQAINRQQIIPVRLNVDQRHYIIDKKLTHLTLPEETSMSLITAESEQLSQYEGQIRFFPDGSSTGGQIKLTYNGKTYYIDVHWLTGKVAITP